MRISFSPSSFLPARLLNTIHRSEKLNEVVKAVSVYLRPVMHYLLCSLSDVELLEDRQGFTAIYIQAVQTTALNN